MEGAALELIGGQKLLQHLIALQAGPHILGSILSPLLVHLGQSHIAALHHQLFIQIDLLEKLQGAVWLSRQEVLFYMVHKDHGTADHGSECTYCSGTCTSKSPF